MKKLPEKGASLLATESFFKAGNSPPKFISRKERKERIEMKGGNGATIGSAVTLCLKYEKPYSHALVREVRKEKITDAKRSARTALAVQYF